MSVRATVATLLPGLGWPYMPVAAKAPSIKSSSPSASSSAHRAPAAVASSRSRDWNILLVGERVTAWPDEMGRGTPPRSPGRRSPDTSDSHGTVAVSFGGIRCRNDVRPYVSTPNRRMLAGITHPDAKEAEVTARFDRVPALPPRDLVAESSKPNWTRFWAAAHGLWSGRRFRANGREGNVATVSPRRTPVYRWDMRTRPVVAYTVAVAAPITAAAALSPFRDRLNSANLALVLVVVIVGVAVTGSRLTAITCAVVTALAYDVLLTQPYGSFSIAQPEEVETAFLLLTVGVTVGSLSNWARQQRVRATEREDYLGLLYHVIEQVSVGTSDESLIAIGEREIAELLGARSCRYVETSERTSEQDQPRPFVDRLGEVHIGALVWPAEETGLPSGEVEVALQSGGMVLGSFVVETTPATAVPRWRLVMVVMVADLIASALARWPSDV